MKQDRERRAPEARTKNLEERERADLDAMEEEPEPETQAHRWMGGQVADFESAMQAS